MRPESRYRSTGWAKFVLGLVMLSWGTASAGPCLMATDAAAGEAVAAEQAHHSGHAGGHHDSAESGHDCDHCPPGGNHAAALCDAGLAAGCGGTVDAVADARKPEPKWQGGPPVVAPPPPAPGEIDAGRHAGAPPDDPARLRRSAGPTLSVLYCVFLK